VVFYLGRRSCNYHGIVAAAMVALTGYIVDLDAFAVAFFDVSVLDLRQCDCYLVSTIINCQGNRCFGAGKPDPVIIDSVARVKTPACRSIGAVVLGT